MRLSVWDMSKLDANKNQSNLITFFCEAPILVTYKKDMF